jgi:hypothetical protein
LAGRKSDSHTDTVTDADANAVTDAVNFRKSKLQQRFVVRIFLDITFCRSG